MLLSCDMILKKRDSEGEVKPETKVSLGTDKDENGCVTSAGYKWSVLRKECIRVFDQGYRLNAIAELKEDGTSFSAFVVFSEDKKEAELFLPNSNESVMLEMESEGIYKKGEWYLDVIKDYTLQKSGVVQYAGAQIEENKITGSDIPEEN
mgnify:CR=1 FL=1